MSHILPSPLGLSFREVALGPTPIELQIFDARLLLFVVNNLLLSLSSLRVFEINLASRALS
jgi:hypothetical protein